MDPVRLDLVVVEWSIHIEALSEFFNSLLVHRLRVSTISFYSHDWGCLLSHKCGPRFLFLLFALRPFCLFGLPKIDCVEHFVFEVVSRKLIVKLMAAPKLITGLLISLIYQVVDKANLILLLDLLLSWR